MKVIESLWFTSMEGVVGIVIIEEDFTKRRKAYIGPASGDDEKLDIDRIISWGNPFSLETASRISYLLAAAEGGAR